MYRLEDLSKSVVKHPCSVKTEIMLKMKHLNTLEVKQVREALLVNQHVFNDMDLIQAHKI